MIVKDQVHPRKGDCSMRKTLAFALLVLPLMLLVAAIPASAENDHAYVGTKMCKKCHIKEWKSWAETKMAEAYESLKPGVDAEVKTELGLDPATDYTTDENCVRCHVTGYGKEGGFTSIDETPELAGIGCEMCHGAGGTYTQDGYMTLKNKEYKRADLIAVGLTHPIGEEVCQQCHNEEVPIPDYSFDFASMKEKGMHEVYELKYNHD
jgi:cytochrome c553